MSLFKKKISEPTLRRLPVYLNLLRRIQQEGRPTVSAPEIAKQVNQDASQVIKDLSVTGIKGKTRVGYHLPELIEALEQFLGFNRTNEAFLVGTGPMGKALVFLQKKQLQGLKIVAAFDLRPVKSGNSIGHINIHDFKYLEELIPKLNIRIAVLTVPSELAQKTTDSLVGFGIRAIWNLSSAILDVPDHVIVQNTPLVDDISVLLHKLRNHDSE